MHSAFHPIDTIQFDVFQRTINAAHECGFRGIISPVVNPSFKREFLDQEIARKQIVFTRSPLVLDANEWLHYVIPCVSIRNIGINDEELRKQNELEFTQEINFARHVQCAGRIYLSDFSNCDPESLGRLMNSLLVDPRKKTNEDEFYVEVSMDDRRKISASSYYGDEEDNEGSDQWKAWNSFHNSLGEASAYVKLALVMTNDLPDKEEIRRWISEAIGLLIIPHSCFVNNGNNFPVLTTQQRKVIGAICQEHPKCHLAVEASGSDTPQRIRNYRAYLRDTYKNNVEKQIESKLLYPLQPLFDNLETAIYQSFETDPSKYKLYQRAIEAALIDKVLESEKEKKRLVLCVLGAGRGPLVRASVNASKNTGRKLKIIIVEKNPNAIVTLSALIELMWQQEDITLISEDMRNVQLEEKADILVSELLGSFGDNELSPECKTIFF